MMTNTDEVYIDFGVTIENMISIVETNTDHVHKFVLDLTPLEVRAVRPDEGETA
jgi:hypothetical protein